jgi:hypothetical protein
VNSQYQKTPTSQLREVQIALGTCRDNFAWGADLRRLDYHTAGRRNVARATSHLEAMRFLYMWTAVNALFSRDSILSLLHNSVLPKPELDRFMILYNAASLPSATTQHTLATLCNTLGTHRAPKTFPWSSRRPLRVIDVIHWKYTPDAYKANNRTSKKIQQIVQNGLPLTTLSLPEIIYSSRNWLVHGSLVDTSFRGNPSEFQKYMWTLSEFTAMIIEHVSVRIRNAV